MSEQQQPETERQKLWREFRETAWDLTRDVASLTVRVPRQYYDHVRQGFGGSEPPISPLRAALEVAKIELAKSAGGTVAFAISPLAGVAGMLAANVVTNIAAAKIFWLNKHEPILPNHDARQRARAAEYGQN